MPVETTLSAPAARLQPSRPGPLVPVLPALHDLLPERGLRPGTVVSVGGDTSLMLALAAAATTAGTWCAAVGLQCLGLVAAAELGVALDRLLLAENPGERWPEVAAALADAVGIMLLRPTGTVAGPLAARLPAVARRTGCALVVAGPWPGAQVRLDVVDRSWVGVGQGRGRLRARRITVASGGRGAAAVGRQAQLWLPDADGAIRRAGPAHRAAGVPAQARHAAAERGPLAVV